MYGRPTTQAHKQTLARHIPYVQRYVQHRDSALTYSQQIRRSWSLAVRSLTTPNGRLISARNLPADVVMVSWKWNETNEEYGKLSVRWYGGDSCVHVRVRRRLNGTYGIIYLWRFGSYFNNIRHHEYEESNWLLIEAFVGAYVRFFIRTYVTTDTCEFQK